MKFKSLILFLFSSCCILSAEDSTLSSNLVFKKTFPSGNTKSIRNDYFRGSNKILSHVKINNTDNNNKIFEYHLYQFHTDIKNKNVLHYATFRKKVHSMNFNITSRIRMGYEDFDNDGLFDIFHFENVNGKSELFYVNKNNILSPISSKEYLSFNSHKDISIIPMYLKLKNWNHLLKNNLISKNEYHNLLSGNNELITKP